MDKKFRRPMGLTARDAKGLLISDRDLRDRFFEKFRATESGCWDWIAVISPQGYGMLSLGSPTGAHRVSYEIHFGQIPEGLEIDHLCRNRCCVNPFHLEAVTRKVNILRGLKARVDGRCKHGHKVEGSNAIPSRTRGLVRCRECTNRTKRESYYRNRVIKNMHNSKYQSL